MIRKACSVFALLLLLATQSSSITSGWPAQEKDFQSVVQIWTLENNKPLYLCSGVVIAPDTVLTTASCIYTKERTQKTKDVFISTAPQLDFSLPVSHTLQHLSSVAIKGIPHPESDLMLIFLKQRINVEPALLLSPGEAFPLRTLSQVFLVGYGLTSPLKAKPGFIEGWRAWLVGEKPKHTGEKMVAKSQITKVEAKDLFLGSVEEDGVACTGDEGAPIFAHIDTPFRNSQRVVGLFVSAPGLSTCTKPGQALRLDTFRGFIHDTMVRECRKKARTWCIVEGLLIPGYDEDPHTQLPPPPSEEKTEPVPVTPANSDEPVTPVPEVSPVPPNSPAPASAQPKPKRRLHVSAEGAGCSCQQVVRKS